MSISRGPDGLHVQMKRRESSVKGSLTATIAVSC